MAYCITLRSRPDTRIITGWYSGSDCQWSTDQTRQKLFDREQDATAVCQDLHNLCPRNSAVINVENALDDPSREVESPIFSSLSE